MIFLTLDLLLVWVTIRLLNLEKPLSVLLNVMRFQFLPLKTPRPLHDSMGVFDNIDIVQCSLRVSKHRVTFPNHLV